MARGSHPCPSNPKGLSQSQPHTNKPSSSSSIAPRKSRWESSSSATPNTTTKPHLSDTKTPKPNNPKPSPKHPDPSPSPKVQPKPQPDRPSPGAPIPFQDPSFFGPPPPPAYGFHMLERRTIILADSSVRSYFALPPDYQDFGPCLRPVVPTGRFLTGPGGHEFDRRFPPPGGLMSPPGGFNEHQGYWNSLGVEPVEGSMKRKYPGDAGKDLGRDEKDEFWKQRQQLSQYGNSNGFPGGAPGEFMAGTIGEDSRASKSMRIGGSYDNSVSSKHLEVDQNKLKKAFLQFAKMINENASQRKNYLEHGKHGRLLCVACGRSSKDFPDMHSLVMHTYNSDNADLLVDHWGLHKALCVLMGWNYSKPPDNLKTYQFLPADEAAANQEDLIMWPPVVMIHNTITGKSKDGRMEGLGNKAMDAKIRDLGFTDGKSKSMYGRDGHLGFTLIKFSSDQAGLMEAIRMVEFFEKENHGRKAWACLQPLTLGSKDDENNPYLVKFDEKTQEKKRIFYGHLGTANDLDKLDFETRKKVLIESQKEYKSK